MKKFDYIRSIMTYIFIRGWLILRERFRHLR